jgi:hypothetical protein
MTASPPPTPLDQIPDPMTIRSYMARLIREQRLCRALLKLAERKQEKLGLRVESPLAALQGGPGHAAS